MVEPIHLTSEQEKQGEHDHSRSAAYASLVIGICTFYICWTLHFAEVWVFWSRQVRVFLASYNMMIALIIMTGLSYLPGVDQDGALERVNIRFAPWDWKPTADRAWVIDPLKGIDIKGIFGALFPALMLYLLFFIDHNISSILTQSPKYNLTKPPAYHWDFFVLGLTIIPCGIMGLPPGSGLVRIAARTFVCFGRSFLTFLFHFLTNVDSSSSITHESSVYSEVRDDSWGTERGFRGLRRTAVVGSLSGLFDVCGASLYCSHLMDSSGMFVWSFPVPWCCK